MKCPRCSGVEDKVIQSRISRDGASIRRRRECLHCGNRFTTYERIEEFTPVVIKKDGTRQRFVPEKIVAGVMKASEKRPVSMDDIEAIRDSIIQDIQRSGDKEIPSSYIGEKVMGFLHRLDTIAYVRFASVYREFKDVDEFMEEVMRLVQHRDSS
ncbi:MAG: transcriptional repressor NrdR [Deltaproteobacteria bacterium]|nr:transcriptional repressor NrdR [Deltaproteobacteria bacterium]